MSENTKPKWRVQIAKVSGEAWKSLDGRLPWAALVIGNLYGLYPNAKAWKDCVGHTDLLSRIIDISWFDKHSSISLGVLLWLFGIVLVVPWEAFAKLLPPGVRKSKAWAELLWSLLKAVPKLRACVLLTLLSLLTLNIIVSVVLPLNSLPEQFKWVYGFPFFSGNATLSGTARAYDLWFQLFLILLGSVLDFGFRVFRRRASLGCSVDGLYFAGVLALICMWLSMATLVIPWQRNVRMVGDVKGICNSACWDNLTLPGKHKKANLTALPPLTKDHFEGICYGPYKDGEGTFLWLYTNSHILQIYPDFTYHDEKNKEVTPEQLRQYVSIINKSTTTFIGLPSARMVLIVNGLIQIFTIGVFWISYWLVVRQIARMERWLAASTMPLDPESEEGLSGFRQLLQGTNNKQCRERFTELVNQAKSEKYVIVKNPTCVVALQQAFERRAEANNEDDTPTPVPVNAHDLLKTLENKSKQLIEDMGHTYDLERPGLPLIASEVTRRVLNTALQGGELTSQRDTLYRYLEEIQRLTESTLQYPRYLVWLMPSLGFIGTLEGIADAFEKARGLGGQTDPALRNEQLDKVLGGLGIAFDTTLVALIGSIIVALLVYHVQYLDLQLTKCIAEYCTTNLLGKQQLSPPENTSSQEGTAQ